MHVNIKQYFYGASAVGAAAALSILVSELTQYLYVSVVLVLPLLLLDHIWSPNSELVGYLTMVALPVGLYLLWSLQLAKGVPKVPERSVGFFAIFLVLALVYQFVSWDFAIKWQGAYFALIAIAVSFSGAIIVAGLLWRTYIQESLTSSSVFHAGMFIWLACLAFPWLGEMP